jgi:hypothetical protein
MFFFCSLYSSSVHSLGYALSSQLVPTPYQRVPCIPKPLRGVQRGNDPPRDDGQMMTGSSTGDSNCELSSPAAVRTSTKAAASVKCEGVEFTVTERNQVAEVAAAAARRACWRARASLTRGRARGATSWTCRGRPRPWCSSCPCARTSAALSPSRGVVNYGLISLGTRRWIDRVIACVMSLSRDA